MRVVGFLILFACLFGCAGSSVLLQGKDKLVRYEQYDKVTGDLDLELVLIEEKHSGYRNYYSLKRNEANIKLVSTPVFEELVRSLEDQDFLEMAKPGVEARRKGVTKVITVENEFGQWVCMNPRDLPCGQENKFAFMDHTVRDCFNRVLALQSVANNEGGDLFYEEQRRLKEENERKGFIQ